MNHTDPYNLRLVLRRLGDLGVQLWHNRGRLYAGPLDQVGADDRAFLTAARDDLVDLLRHEGYQPWNIPDLVAPAPPEGGGFQGVSVRKPWHYECAVIIPHFGKLDMLRAAVACWRNQTVSPYIVIVDTGGEDDLEYDDESLRGFDCEIHYIAAHGWRHSSAPVSAALDLAFAVCQAPIALLTHEDVFARHDHVIEDLLPRVSRSCPVVGYRMSPRMGSTEWHLCVSHTLTLCHMPTMRKARASWNLLAAQEQDNEVGEMFLGWPDTETWFSRSLRASGIVPEFLGDERNEPMYSTEYIVHWRSAPSLRHYDPKASAARHPGFAAWLDRTEHLGRAADLPDVADVAASEHRPDHTA